MLRRLAREIVFQEGEPLPTEFRLFKVGLNETTKGPTLWDAKAAELVMAEYARRGVSGVIDLNHDSLDPMTRRMRKDAADAMGAYELELRNGELWMTNIRFNPEGEERLRMRKQRFFSPAVFCESETDRVVELINVALTADPATYDARPLIAASRAVSLNVQTRALARAIATKR